MVKLLCALVLLWAGFRVMGSVSHGSRTSTRRGRAPSVVTVSGFHGCSGGPRSFQVPCPVSHNSSLSPSWGEYTDRPITMFSPGRWCLAWENMPVPRVPGHTQPHDRGGGRRGGAVAEGGAKQNSCLSGKCVGEFYSS